MKHWKLILTFPLLLLIAPLLMGPSGGGGGSSGGSTGPVNGTNILDGSVSPQKANSEWPSRTNYAHLSGVASTGQSIASTGTNDSFGSPVFVPSSASGGGFTVTNIWVQATNSIVLNFAQANVFKLTLSTNVNWIGSNSTLLTSKAFIYYLMDTNAGTGYTIASYANSGGKVDTNTSMQPIGSQSYVEVMPGFFTTNIWCTVRTNFSPTQSPTNSLATGGGGGGGGGTALVLTAGLANGSRAAGSGFETNGFQFTLSANKIATDLGRWVKAGNSQTHVLLLYDTLTCTELARVTVNCSGATTAAFLYGSITPTALLSGHTYAVYSEEDTTDLFYIDCPITYTADASATTSAYVAAGNCQTSAGDQAFGPVNIKLQ